MQKTKNGQWQVGDLIVSHDMDFRDWGTILIVGKYLRFHINSYQYSFYSLRKGFYSKNWNLPDSSWKKIK